MLADLFDRAQLDEVAARVGDLKHYPKAHRCEVHCREAFVEAVQQRQGLYSFRVVMDESNNTPDVIDRNILAGQIFLQPAKTAEFIVIDFNILPTGASFSA
jgi:hypothetical protein